jgi:Iap family predicted aminopeptidase
MNPPVTASRGVLDAAIDVDYMRRVIERLAATGSSPLGFRLAGTPEEVALSGWIAEQMEAIGLVDVALEPVPVDAWRFRGAYVEAPDRAIECASFGGAVPTPAGGVAGDVVFIGRGTRDEIDGLDLRGKVVIIDWRGTDLLWPSMPAAEAARAGAVAALVTSLPGGYFYQREGALGAFDTYGLPDAIPMLTLRKEDAQELIDAAARGPLGVRVVLDAEVQRGATAYNVVGTLPGRRDESPVVVAGHHDAWFYGALDDASGVASTLAIAKAMRDTGYVPDGPIVFGSHTAEEFGLLSAPFDYCIGAGWQIQHEHPEWAQEAALYLNLEGTGMPRPLLIEAPAELAAFAAEVCAAATEDGLLPHGLIADVPRPWTEAWPFLAMGVPAINVNSHHLDFFRTEYHTQFDDPAFLDYDNLGDLTCVYARLIVAADARGRRLVEPAARVADVHRRGRLGDARDAGARVEPLERALERYERAAATATPDAARRAFTHLAQALEAIDASEAPVLLHEQALRDVQALDAAQAALAAGDLAGAAGAAERVGRNVLARDLSDELVALDAERHSAAHEPLAWAELGHLTASPVLCRELAALRAGSVPDLAAARRRSAEDLDERIRATTEAFDRAAALLGDPVGPTEET